MNAQGMYAQNCYYNGTNWIYDKNGACGAARMLASASAPLFQLSIATTGTAGGTISTMDTTGVAMTASLSSAVGTGVWINPGGNALPTNHSQFQVGPVATVDSGAEIQFNNQQAGDRALVIMGASGQTAALTTWNVNSTTPLASVTAAGGFVGTSLLASGNVDGTAPTTITTGTTASLGGTFKSGYTHNQEATAAAGVTYTLPTAAAGLQYCIDNSWNGSAATTGVLTLATSASGQFIIFTDGTLSATGGNVTSGGAAADAACVTGIDATHWQLFVQRGTWTKH